MGALCVKVVSVLTCFLTRSAAPHRTAMSEFRADAKDVLKAAFTGFVSYLLPVALIRGGKLGQSVVRSAGAFAIFTGSYRG